METPTLGTHIIIIIMVLSGMEGTLASSCEIWLRDVGTAKSGLVLERWWVEHRLRSLRTVVISGDEHAYARKGCGKGKEKVGGTVFFEKDHACFAFAIPY